MNEELKEIKDIVNDLLCLNWLWRGLLRRHNRFEME